MTGYLGNNDVVYVYRLKPANGKQENSAAAIRDRRQPRIP